MGGPLLIFLSPSWLSATQHESEAQSGYYILGDFCSFYWKYIWGTVITELITANIYTRVFMCMLTALRGAGQPQRELISACVDLRSNEVPILFKHWIMGLPGSCLWVQKTNSPPSSFPPAFCPIPQSILRSFHQPFPFQAEAAFLCTDEQKKYHSFHFCRPLLETEGKKWKMGLTIYKHTINNHNIMTSTERQIGYISDLNPSNPVWLVMSKPCNSGL